MKLLILVVTFVTLCGKFVSSEYFSSTDELMKLINNKEEMIGSLRGFNGELEKGSESLKSKLTSLTSEHKLMTQNPQTYIENPLNAFILIKTLSHDVEEIKFHFREAFKSFSNAAKINQLPTTELNGVIDAFVRLREIYKINIEDLAFGIVDGTKVRRQLTVEQILLIAELMRKRQRLELAQEFYMTAKEKTEDKNEKYKILELLFSLAKNDDDFTKTAKILSEMEKLKPRSPDDLKKLLIDMQKLNEKDPKEPFKFEGTYFTPEKSEYIYGQACNGFRLQSVSVTSKLFCKFKSVTLFTKIAPFKEEILNNEPFVAIYHDVIGDGEIEELKNITRGGMTDGKVLKFKKVKDYENKIADKISKRVGDLTGLNMASGEDLKIQNYGIGGFDKMHFDFDSNANENGNRIASVMFHLSDVEKGGATIFPFLRLYIRTKKGNALVFNDLSSSGDLEYLTYHGSCPVTLGNKWIATKWIREIGQEFTRPCELQRKPTDEKYLQNYYTL